MKYEQVKDELSLVLSKEYFDKVESKLDRFKDDEFLTAQLLKNIAGKNLRDLAIEQYHPIIRILNGIVCKDYPSEEVSKYSQLYFNAIRCNRIDRFGNILSHLNSLKGLEERLVSDGIVPNKNKGQKIGTDYSDPIDTRQYVFEQGSYLDLISGIFIERDEKINNMVPLNDRLSDFYKHLESLKSKGISSPDLFKFGFSQLITSLDDMYHLKTGNSFEDSSAKVIKLLSSLENRGFELNHKSTIDTIISWVKNNKLNEMTHTLPFLGKEAIMYLSGIHLKKE